MAHKIKIFFLFTLIILLGGCGQARNLGSKISISKLGDVLSRPDITKQEVVDAIGAPNIIDNDENDNIVYYYLYHKLSPQFNRCVDYRKIALIFDEENKLIDFRCSAKYRERKINSQSVANNIVEPGFWRSIFLLKRR